MLRQLAPAENRVLARYERLGGARTREEEMGEERKGVGKGKYHEVFVLVKDLGPDFLDVLFD